MFKSGFVAIIGRPNVGKSTIINYLMGEKLAIVSNKPQTTRKNMNLILTEENYQIIFVDTPGIHKPKHKLGEYMVNEAEEMVTEVDLIIFVTNSNKEIHIGDIKILEELKGVKCPVFLVMNKSDEVNSDLLASSLQKHSETFDFAEIIPTSARNGKNMDVLLNLILENLKEGPMYYPEDIATDSQERFIVNELIREKALRFLKDEVPHGIAVEIVKMKDKEECYEISANLICEKKSHKGIIIGKNGQMLKKIKNSAKKDIEDFLGTKVNLDIWVKVRKDWRDNPLFLNQFGYKKLK